jgi:DNA-binding MarR family transcriptional regulator
LATDDLILQKVLQRLDDIDDAMRENIEGRPYLHMNYLDIELTIRRVRDQHFDSRYFTDAAWEILLDLKRSAQLGQRLATSDLGLAAGIPLTTILRYIDRLVKDGYVVRRDDQDDRRRVFVDLTELGIEAMDSVFNKVNSIVERQQKGRETSSIESPAAVTNGAGRIRHVTNPADKDRSV